MPNKVIMGVVSITDSSPFLVQIDDSGRFLLSSLLATPTQWSDGYCYCSDCIVLKAKGNLTCTALKLINFIGDIQIHVHVHELFLIPTGNSCPVCGECYLDNDFDSKVI